MREKNDENKAFFVFGKRGMLIEKLALKSAKKI
jgi:hypothetical protein